MKANYLILAVFMALALPASAGLCAAPQTGKVITNVTSENMIYDSAGQKVTFSGNVKVTHPDFILDSDRLELLLTPSGSASPGGQGAEGVNPGAVRTIIAESKVRIALPEGRTATCNKATYNVENETLTMEGNPVLREGANQVRGDKMIFHLRENRNEVQGRVTVDFISGGEAPSGLGEGGLGIMGGNR